MRHSRTNPGAFPTFPYELNLANMDWKDIHIALAGITLVSFVARGLGMALQAGWLNAKPVRILPHVIDTLLLGSGLYLAWTIQQFPGTDAWLTAKLLALLAYIGLGMVALRRGRTLAVRLLAFGLALGVFGYMVVVAVTRNPWPI